jgi:hypothetical protein
MYAIFGDWELVLASYRKIQDQEMFPKAIRRSIGKQDYWSIRDPHLQKKLRVMFQLFNHNVFV